MSTRDTDVLGIDKAAEVRALGKRLEAKKDADIKAHRAEQDRHKYGLREELYVRVTRSGPVLEGEIVSGLPEHIQRHRKWQVKSHSLEGIKAEVRFAFQRLLLGWLIVRDPVRASERAANAEVRLMLEPGV